VGIGVHVLRPPADGDYLREWVLRADAERALDVLSAVWKGFVPVPLPGLHFWNTNVLDGLPWLGAALGVGLLALVSARFRASPAALACWAVGAGGLLLFAYTKQPGSQRHHGHLFLVFLAASWWMARERPRDSGKRRRPGRIAAVTGRWVEAVLGIQLLAGLHAGAMDAAFPFSSSQAVARYLVANGLDDRLIVADLDWAAVPVVGRLDRPRVYYPRARRSERLVLWDKRRTRPFGEKDFVDAVAAIRLRSAEPVLVLTNYALHDVPDFFTLLARFEPGIVEDEAYTLFRVRPGRRRAGGHGIGLPGRLDRRRVGL
jgi:hypothetical protein